MSQVVTKYTAIPVAGAAALVIRCTMMSSRMRFWEDPAANAGVAQGLIYQRLTPNGNRTFSAGPQIELPPAVSTTEPVLIAGYPGDHPPNTVPIGNGGSGGLPAGPGAQPSHGTQIFQVTSASATPTNIFVEETE